MLKLYFLSSYSLCIDVDKYVKVSWACVNHGPYLRDLTKIPFKKPIDSGTMKPEELKR